MTFQSANSNLQVSQDPVVRKTTMNIGAIPIFGVDGKMVDSGCSINEDQAIVVNSFVMQHREHPTLEYLVEMGNGAFHITELFTKTCTIQNLRALNESGNVRIYWDNIIEENVLRYYVERINMSSGSSDRSNIVKAAEGSLSLYDVLDDEVFEAPSNYTWYLYVTFLDNSTASLGSTTITP